MDPRRERCFKSFRATCIHVLPRVIAEQADEPSTWRRLNQVSEFGLINFCCFAYLATQESFYRIVFGQKILQPALRSFVPRMDATDWCECYRYAIQQAIADALSACTDVPEDWGDTQNQFKIDMYCSALSLLLLCLHDGFFETPPASKVLGLISRGELTPDALDVGFKEALTADHLAGMLGVERPGGRERINMATAFFVLLAGSGDHEIQGP